MKTSLRTTLLLVAAFLATEAASVVVAPTAIYMDHATRSATLTLFNPSTRAEEVTIDAIFGYPSTDEDGNLRLELIPGGDERSAAEWILAYPRQLVIPPGGRQVVRLLGQPPVDLPDGEYWARLAISSRGQEIPVAGAGGAEEVRVGLGLEVRTLIAATYRKGAVTTGVQIQDWQPRYEEGKMILRPRLTREGNGAYIGALRVALEGPGGEVVAEWTEQVAVYRNYHRRLSYDVQALPSGRYRLRLRLSTDREDIPREHRLPSGPVELTTTFEKP